MIDRRDDGIAIWQIGLSDGWTQNGCDGFQHFSGIWLFFPPLHHVQRFRSQLMHFDETYEHNISLLGVVTRDKRLILSV
jgi:hypothetical protein